MRERWMLAAGLLALAGCGQSKQAYVDGAWARLNAVAGRPAAAYFTLHGGATDATLVGVSSDAAIRAEMHDLTMRRLGQVAVPAGAAVAFKPGERHVMLFDVNPATKPGSAMTLTFAFADGRHVSQKATVIAPGDAAPKK